VSRFALRCVTLLVIVFAAACDKVPLLAPTDSVVTLSIDSTTVGLNGTAELIATVIEPAGTPVHNGTTVTFTTSMGVVEPRDARTEGGIARAIFRAGTQSGTATITAFSGSARSDPIEILLGGAAAERVTVRTEPASVPTTGGAVEVIAVVVDVSGNPLQGAPVIFSSDAGTLSSNSSVSDQNGQARTTLTTNRETVVRASVAGKEGTATVRAVDVPLLTITPSANPVAGKAVVFTIAAAGGATGNPIVNAVIDFGDGSPPAQLGAVPSTGSIATAHVYQRGDVYTVRATATDNTGLQGTSTTVVVVQRVVPLLSLTVSPSSPTVGQAATVSVSITNPENITVQSVTVFFGNGTQSSLGAPQSGTHSTSTVYTSAGTYTVRAQLVDVNGQVSEAATQVVVRAAF
jgi:hypothetical protein